VDKAKNFIGAAESKIHKDNGKKSALRAAR